MSQSQYWIAPLRLGVRKSHCSFFPSRRIESLQSWEHLLSIEDWNIYLISRYQHMPWQRTFSGAFPPPYFSWFMGFFCSSSHIGLIQFAWLSESRIAGTHLQFSIQRKREISGNNGNSQKEPIDKIQMFPVVPLFSFQLLIIIVIYQWLMCWTTPTTAKFWINQELVVQHNLGHKFGQLSTTSLVLNKLG